MVKLIFTCVLFSSFLLSSSFEVLQDTGKKNNSLLWEVSGNDLLVSSYLYGTIHLICNENLKISEEVVNALLKTEQLALEVDLSNPNFDMEFQKGMVMQEGSNLRKLLPKEDYQLLDRFFKDSLDVDLKQVEVIKPYFMGNMLYPKLLGCNPQPYELQIIEFASANSKPITGLWTIQQKLDQISSISYKKQAQMLVESISNFKRAKKMYKSLLGLYKQQDIEKAHELLQSSTPGLEEFEKSLIESRNKLWLPVIDSMATEKATFFAVGAEHLGGETGLIKLLKKQGYTLTPIIYTEDFQVD